MGRKLYAKGEGFNPSTSIEDVEGLREELDALKGGSGGGGGDNTAIERRLTTAEGEIDALQGDVAEQSEEIAAVGAKVDTLQGTDAGKSVRTIAAEETAKIVGNAPANYDTLKEIADYISSDATGAAEMSNKINKNTTDIAKVAEDLSATHQLASNAESAISEVVELTIPAIENELENKLGKTEKAADSEKLGGVGADGYTRVLKGSTNVVNNHLYIGTLPVSSNMTKDSISIRGTVGGFGGNSDFVDIAIGRRDGLWFKGLSTFRYTGTSSYWDIVVNDAGEVYVLLYKQYCAYLIEVSSRQVTIEGVHGRTPTDTNWRYLREELSPFDNITSDTFTAHTATNGRRAYFDANGFNMIGNLTSGWAGGLITRDADGNSTGGIIGAYGQSSYTPSFIYIGGTYDNPIIKAYIDGAVEMKSTLTTKGNITAPKFIGALQGNADSSTKLATPRKIWGQSFDGSGDIDGDMEVNGDVVIKGNVVIEGNITSGASYQSNSLSTISEDEVPSVEQQLRSQISSLEERISTLEQLIAQNNG